MHQVTKGLNFVFVYIDDVLIFSHSVEEHIEHLTKLFQRLSEFGLRIKPSKCLFGVSELTFLSHKITMDGITPSPNRVDKIRDFPEPKSLKQLQRFIGMVNYYHRFIPNLAKKMIPLYDLLTQLRRNKRQTGDIEWSIECQESFDDIKSSLINVTLLTFPKENAPLRLSTDASGTDVGAVLEQLEDKGWRPIAFFSKKLDDKQSKYSTFDRELLAIFLAIKHFQHFLEDEIFHVYTDHQPLTGALSSKSSRSPRVERQLEYIAQFTTDIRYVKGSENKVADTLSRPNTDSIDFLTNNLLNLSKAQETDKELQDLCSNPLEDSNVNLESVKIPASNISLWCETSNKTPRPYIPKEFRQEVFNSVHSLSHPSVRTTRKKLSHLYFWPNMNKDINLWTTTCVQCQKQKIHRHVKTPIENISVPRGRFRHVHVDIVGPLPSSNGNKYILTAIDRFSRWPEAFAIPDIETKTIARTLVNEYFSRFGIPLQITTDQGRQFESRLFSDLCKTLGCSHIHTSPYHPCSNGMIERFHRQLKAAIRATQDTMHWSEVLPLVLLGIRTTIKDEIGHSPSELLYGEEIRVPNELYIPTDLESIPDPSKFVEQLKRTFEKLKPVETRSPKRQNIHVPKDLYSAEQVLVRFDDKLNHPLKDRYEGPFQVVERFPKVVKINKNGNLICISWDRTKPFKSILTSAKLNSQTKKSKKISFKEGGVMWRQHI